MAELRWCRCHPHDLYALRRGIAWAPRLDGRVLAADVGREP